MDYGDYKLPVTGATFFGVASLTDQLLLMAAMSVGVVAVGLLIRYVWRRNKTIGS